MELNECLWHGELGPESDCYRKHQIWLLVASATDAIYEGMMKEDPALRAFCDVLNCGQ